VRCFNEVTQRDCVVTHGNVTTGLPQEQVSVRRGCLVRVPFEAMALALGWHATVTHADPDDDEDWREYCLRLQREEEEGEAEGSSAGETDEDEASDNEGGDGGGDLSDPALVTLTRSVELSSCGGADNVQCSEQQDVSEGGGPQSSPQSVVCVRTNARHEWLQRRGDASIATCASRLPLRDRRTADWYDATRRGCMCFVSVA
jgi:hypothetical protein